MPLNDYLQWAPGDIMQATSFSDVQRMHRQLQRELASAAVDAERRHGRSRPRRRSNFFHLCALNQCPPQSATARVGNVNDNRSDNRNLSAKIVSTSSWNAQVVGEPQDHVRRRLHEPRERHRQHDRTRRFRRVRRRWPRRRRSARASAADRRRRRSASTCRSRRRFAIGCSSRSRRARTRTARSARTSSASLYPKVSLSWILSDESFFPHASGFLNQFRLRASYGASGVQPGRTQGLVTFAPGHRHRSTAAARRRGTDTPALTASNPGQREPQAGAVAGVRGRIRDAAAQQPRALRLHVLQQDDARRADQRADRAVGGRVGDEPARRTSARRRTPGTRLQLNAQLVDRRRFGWDVTLTGSHNTALIVDLGIDPSTGPAAHHRRRRAHRAARRPSDQRQWYHPYTYNDANHDGVLQVSEVHVDSSFQNFGNAIPRDLFSIQTGFDLFNRRLRITSLFDYKGGYSTQDGANNFQCNSVPLSCRRRRIRTRRWRSRRRRSPRRTARRSAGRRTRSRRRLLHERSVLEVARSVGDSCSFPDASTSLLRAQNGSSIVFARAQSAHVEQLQGHRSRSELRPERQRSRRTSSRPRRRRRTSPFRSISSTNPIEDDHIC